MTAARSGSLAWPWRLLLAALLLPGVVALMVQPLQAIYFYAYGLVAAVLITRRPSNAIGPIVLILAYGFLVTSMPIDQVDLAAARAGSLAPAEALIVWINAWGGAASFTTYLALALLFPTGRFPDGRGRRPSMAALAFAIGMTALIAVAPTVEFNPAYDASPEQVPNPFAILPDVQVWSLIPSAGPFLVIMALLIVAVGSMVVRYRRATGVLRLQLRWLVAALAFLVAGLAFGLAVLIAFEGGAGFVGWLPESIAFVLVPVAIGVAVLRYRLYEIDRIISRTIGYALVSGVLVVVFVSVVLGLQSLFEPLTGGNTVAVAASTLIVAALFQPLRRRTQHVVDRRFDRARYDGEQTLAGFATRLRDQVELETIEVELDGVVRLTMAPSSLALWIGRPEARE